MYKVGIITASDKGSKGQREDLSGKAINDIVTSKGYKVLRQVIVPDEESELIREMKYMADDLKADLILTTGGTGFSKRDMTPVAQPSSSIRSFPRALTKDARRIVSTVTRGPSTGCQAVNAPYRTLSFVTFIPSIRPDVLLLLLTIRVRPLLHHIKRLPAPWCSVYGS